MAPGRIAVSTCCPSATSRNPALGVLGFPIAYVINRRRLETLGLDLAVVKRVLVSSPLFGLSVIAAGSSFVGSVLLDSLVRGGEVGWLTIFLIAQNLWLTWILAAQLERSLWPANAT